MIGIRRANTSEVGSRAADLIATSFQNKLRISTVVLFELGVDSIEREPFHLINEVQTFPSNSIVLRLRIEPVSQT